MTIISRLHDTHVLVMVTDDRVRKVLSRSFSAMGATIHTADTQTKAIGLYWKLYRAGIRPRLVVTSWSMVSHESDQYKYLELLGRTETDGTALNLIVNIADLDPTAFITVYTAAPLEAAEILGKSGLEAEIFDRTQINPVDFVAQIACHRRVNSQRVNADDIRREIADRAVRSDSDPALPLRANYG